VDAYELALFAHLTGLMLLTGGVTVSIAAKALARRRDDPSVIHALWQLAHATVRRVAIPGSLLLLVAGGALVHLSHGAYSWSEPWIAGAVVFWVASALIGVFLHGPRSRAVRTTAAAEAAAGADQASTTLRTHAQGGVLIGSIDAGLLIVMVALMVFKPG
jgi:hypothetical protein